MATTVTLADGLLLMCAVLAVLRSSVERSLHPPTQGPSLPRPWLVFVGLIALGGVFSSLRASDPWGSIGITARLVAVTGVLPLLAWRLVREEVDLLKAAIALTIAGAVQGAAALLQIAGVESALFGTDRFGRYTGFAGHPNDLGATLAITMPVSLACLVVWRRRRLALALLACACLATAGGLLVSGSLSAMIGSAAGVVVTLAILLRGDRRSATWACVGVAGLAAVASISILVLVPARFFPEGAGFAEVKDPRTRLAEVLGGSGTLAARAHTIDAALDDIASNPIVGLGFDHESTDVFEGGQVHSMPVLAWQAGGLPVLLGLVGITWLALRSAWPRKARTSGTLRAVRAGLVGAITAMVINGMAQPFLYKRFGWIPVALAFSPPVLSALAPRSDRRMHESASAPGVGAMDAAAASRPIQAG